MGVEGEYREPRGWGEHLSSVLAPHGMPVLPLAPFLHEGQPVGSAPREHARWVISDP